VILMIPVILVPSDSILAIHTIPVTLVPSDRDFIFVFPMIPVTVVPSDFILAIPTTPVTVVPGVGSRLIEAASPAEGSQAKLVAVVAGEFHDQGDNVR
jgi:hypothetical protein